MPEIVNLEAIPRNITDGGNWVALRDTHDSAVKRCWGTSDDRAVLEVFFTAAGLGHYMFNGTLQWIFADQWRFHGDLPINAVDRHGTKLNFVVQ